MTNVIKLIKQYLNLETIIGLLASIAFLVLAMVVANGAQLFGPTPDDVMPLSVLITLSVISLLLFAGMIFYAIKKKEYKPNRILAIILSVLFVIQLITILTFKNGQTYSLTISDGSIYSFTFSLEGADYIRNIISFLFVLLACFYLADFIPKTYEKDNVATVIFSILFIVAAFFLIVASLILEFDKIVGLFHLQDFSDIPSLSLRSLFISKNNFGIILLCGIIATIYLANKKFNYLYFIVLFIIELFLLLTQCKLGIVLSVFLIIGFGIIKFIETYKQNKKRNWIVLGSVVGTILVVSLILFLVPKTNELIRNIIDNVFQEKFGKSTMDGRIKIWEYSFIEMSYFNRFSGAGFKTFNQILAFFNNSDVEYYVTFDTSSAHNAYIELLGNGGISFFLVYILIFSFMVYFVVKVFKKDPKLAAFEILLLIVILTLSFLEGGLVIFSQTLEYLYLSAMLMIPLTHAYLKYYK